MTARKLTTTTIGSFPKPDYVPVEDWFDAARNKGVMDTALVTQNYTGYQQKKNANDEALFIKAAKEVIDIQIKAGIDIPTDGEVRRENYIHYHCRHLGGFDFTNLEYRVQRDGAYESNLPAIRGPVTHNGNFYAARDFLASQAVSSRDIKFTLPGPLTVMDTNADCFYDDRPRLNKDIAQTINQEILSLVEAGCKYIQVDEPLFARQRDDALSFGSEGIESCFHNVPADVTKIVHICCGYPNHLDDHDYNKAPPDSYHYLAKSIDHMSIDQVSIEDAHCGNDLRLLDMFEKKTIIFGVIAVAKSRVEGIDEIKDRLNKALQHIDADRLVVAPDCGLGFLSAGLAKAKLEVMCEAVAAL